MNFLLKDKVFILLVVIPFVLLVVGSLLIYTNMDSFSYPLILHFNDLQGVDVVGGVFDLWKPILMAGFIFMINLVLSYVLYFRERFLAYIILAVSVLISILTLIAVSNIISLN